SSSPSTSAGSDPPSRSGVTYRVTATFRSAGTRYSGTARRGLLWRRRAGEVVGLAQPLGDRRFDLVPMLDVDQIRALGRRRLVDLPHLGRLDGPAEEHAQLEHLLLQIGRAS